MSASPQQVAYISEERQAIAPYNFVPLPQRIVPAQVETIVGQHGSYLAERHTGTISCTLTAETPLYVRTGLTPEQYAAWGENPLFKLSNEEIKQLTNEQQRQLHEQLESYAQFFHYSHKGETIPVIPGSTLRGLLRALVEIASFGKMERVTDRQRYFFRAVAAKRDDPLAQPYRAQLRNVRAGYLRYQEGAWFIQPAIPFGADGYLKVPESLIPASLDMTSLDDDRYKPQYKKVSFTPKMLKPSKRSPKGRMVVDKLGLPGEYTDPGYLTTSGNMLETGKKQIFASPRKNHPVIGAEDTSKLPIKIDPQAIQDYQSSLTEFQKKPPFHKLRGIFADQDGQTAEGRPIFYCQPAKGEPVTLFGQSPNFRVPYRFAESKRAASPADFVPDAFKNPDIMDIAEAIFGFVRANQRDDYSQQARAGRIFVSDAAALGAIHWLLPSGETLIPQILASPKPTTFQHYLTQSESELAELHHYASSPGEQTVIRGHKLYWHQGAVGSNHIREQDSSKLSEAAAGDSQHTHIRPVAPGSQFRFTIHIENLSDVELGALLWVLRLTDERYQTRAYRLKLGMGKPLGMGAIKLEHRLQLSDRTQRYAQLFDEHGGWQLGEQSADPQPIADHCVAAFHRYMLERCGEKSANNTIDGTLRIQTLLALLSWPGPSDHARYTRYMEIEHGPQKVNEYKLRPVLPTPLQVLQDAEGYIAPTIRVGTASAPASLSSSQLPTVGAIVAGKITNLDADAAIVEIEQFDPQHVIGVLQTSNMQGRKYQVGNKARFEVIDSKILKNGRLVLELKAQAKQ